MDYPTDAAKIVAITNTLREQLTRIAKQIKELEALAKPPVVQELVIARRAAEDARMRLGMGGAYARGLDPLENKFQDQKQG
jgi:hypothetical protein